MKKLFLLLMAVISLSVCANAQLRTVTGTVLDADTDEELIGATVTDGQGHNAPTDASGHFSLKVPAAAKTLTVSYVGYKTQQVAITDKPITVRLQPDNALLDPIIVVAYGEQKKSSFTGSAASVGSADIEKSQVTNVLDALGSKVPGLQLSNASGAPGSSDPTIRIRGFSSLSAGNAPLIIVDGTPYTGDLNAMNTNDIENMSVLKDAASAALYGARGANGVILITTKRAKLGEATVTVDAKWGANMRATQDYDYIKNPAMYYETYYRSLYNYAAASTANNGLGYSANNAYIYANNTLAKSSNGGLGYIIYDVPAGQMLIGQNGKLNPNATYGRKINYGGEEYYLRADNWLKDTYNTGLRQEYNVTISQGTDKSNILASMNYLSNEGIVSAPSSFERFTGRISADFQAKSWLKVGVNASYGHTVTNMLGGEGSSTSTVNIFAFATQIAPIYPLYLRDGNGKIMYDNNGFKRYDFGNGENGGLVRPIFSDFNALATANLDKRKSSDNQFTGTGYAEIRFLKDFKFTTKNNINLYEYRQTALYNPYYGQYVTVNGQVFKGHYRNTDMTFQQLLNWNHLFGKHNVTALLGHEYYKTVLETLDGSKTGIFLPSNDELAGAITDKSPDSSRSMYNNEGFFFNGQYDFDGRYFFSASYRRDASSRFAKNHRWGNFWSVGGAWIASKEDFFNVDWINLLKVKLSYGEQGNDNIGDYRFTNTYNLINSCDYPAVTPATKGNENITWEKGGNLNAGVEFEMFNSRLTGEINGFYRTTNGMLMSFPLPASAGFMGYYMNIGDMMNGGIEVALSGTPIRTRDFRWTIDANFTWYKNEITKLPEERKSLQNDGKTYGYTSSGYLYSEGCSRYTFWMTKYAGVDPESGKSMFWVAEKDPATGKATGEMSTTTDYSEATMFNCGSALAPAFGGFSTSAEYKGFDLSVNFQYQIGGKVYDSGYQALMSNPVSSSGGSNIHADILKAWTPEKPNSNIPRFQYGDLEVAQTQSRFLTDASYLSLQNINFGYSLPKNIIKKMYLSKLRVYFAADNIWVWSKRQGLDPRQSFTGASNNNYYAPIRTLSGGITVQF